MSLEGSTQTHLMQEIFIFDFEKNTQEPFASGIKTAVKIEAAAGFASESILLILSPLASSHLYFIARCKLGVEESDMEYITNLDESTHSLCFYLNYIWIFYD